MKGIRATVTHPTTREDGEALPIEEIAGVKFAMSVDPTGLGWDPLNGGAIVPTGTKTFTINDLASGTYHIRAIWEDKNGQPSKPVTATIELPQEPPNSGTLTLELV